MDLNQNARNNLKNSISQPFHIKDDIWLVPCLASYTSNDYKPLICPLNLDKPESGAGLNYWTQTEDEILQKIIQSRGAKSWSLISKELNALVHEGHQIRQGKNCRERWKNHLNPELVKGKWLVGEDEFILAQFTKLGNRWSKIAKKMKGRTENSVKNRYHYLMKLKENEPKIELKLDALSNCGTSKRDLDNGVDFNGNSEKNLRYNQGVVIRPICDQVAIREKIRSIRQRLKREERVLETTPSPSIFLL